MEETEYDLGTGMTIITIILEDIAEPKIELDGCHPLVAANIFRNAAEMIEEMMQKPTITTYGQIIAADDDVLFAEYDVDNDGDEA